MRYRIFVASEPVIDIEAYDLRVTRERRIAVVSGPKGEGWSVDVNFFGKITRIADDHNGDIYVSENHERKDRDHE